MTQMAPMLEMMKAKMGQAPLRHDDADHGTDDEPDDGRPVGGGFGGMLGGGGMPGRVWRRRVPFAPGNYGVGRGRRRTWGGMLSGGGGSQLMNMIPQFDADGQFRRADAGHHPASPAAV